MLASIIIRTYNEELFLDKLLSMIKKQHCKKVNYEIVIVDSGSTDRTLEIAQKHKCKITHIHKHEFTFGRSLNIGCEFSQGQVLVFISGHCIPVNECWLESLCKPLVNNSASYAYGRQIGAETTKYSEHRHFEKWFPDYSKLPQEGFFCNNANAAIQRKAWEKYQFDEELTGLEDMFLAKQLVTDKNFASIGYVADASVYHIHNENWQQVCLRYERESYALHRIMPDVQVTFRDFLRFFLSAIFSDLSFAIKEKVFIKKMGEIILFRFYQYWGSYKGNHLTRKLTEDKKNQYYYPKAIKVKRSSKQNFESLL